jgi:hypothetical protein
MKAVGSIRYALGSATSAYIMHVAATLWLAVKPQQCCLVIYRSQLRMSYNLTLQEYQLNNKTNVTICI